MRVLILTMSTGQGHNQTSKALSEYLKSKGHECQIIDAYRFCNRALSDVIEKGYETMAKFTPKMYGGMYQMMEKHPRWPGEYKVKKFSNKIIASKLVSHINEYSPDAIVCTHVLPARILTDLRYKLCSAKIYGIITDFTLHPYWDHTKLDYYVTPSRLLNHQFIVRGISEDKILDFGIPIHPKFSQKISQAAAREKFGLNPEKSTVMIMMGSMGTGNVAKLVKRVDAVDADFQIICVCGKNRKAKTRVDKLVTRHEIRTFGFTDQVNDLMDASNLIVTKPGGLTVSECLAKGLYMILNKPIPGHEDRNREFLVNNGLASVISSTYSVEEAIYQYLKNDIRRQQYGDLVKEFARPNAAENLCELMERQTSECMQMV